MTEENELIAPPPEEKSLALNLIDLPDQSESIVPINTSIVTSFCAEIEAATTTKRMVTIENSEDKFLQSFLNIERFQEFTKVYEDMTRIFKNMRSDAEFDYLKLMIDSLEEESNDETSD